MTDDRKNLSCTELKESLKKSIKGFLKNDPKSAVRVSIANVYGFQTFGYDANLFLKMLENECKKGNKKIEK